MSLSVEKSFQNDCCVYDDVVDFTPPLHRLTTEQFFESARNLRVGGALLSGSSLGKNAVVVVCACSERVCVRSSRGVYTLLDCGHSSPVVNTWGWDLESWLLLLLCQIFECCMHTNVHVRMRDSCVCFVVWSSPNAVGV